MADSSRASARQWIQMSPRMDVCSLPLPAGRTMPLVYIGMRMDTLLRAAAAFVSEKMDTRLAAIVGYG